MVLLVDYMEYGMSDVDCEELKRWLIDKRDFWAIRLQLVEEEN